MSYFLLFLPTIESTATHINVYFGALNHVNLEGRLTTVEGRSVVDISRHEGRFRLLPNRVVPHPADPTLEEGAQHT